MKILLCYKWERSSGEATVTHDGNLKWFDTKLKASDDDAAAVKCARQIVADTEGSSLTGVTIGDGDTTWAMARGATGAVSVDAYMPDADDTVTAARLANAVKAAGDFDVVMMGDAQEHAGVAPVMAAILGLPLVSGVSDVTADPDNADCLIAHRVTSESDEVIRVHAPAVIAVAAANTEKEMPRMKAIMAAKKMPVNRVDAEQLDAVRSSCVDVKDGRLPDRRRVKLYEGEAAETVGSLVSALCADGLL